VLQNSLQIKHISALTSISAPTSSLVSTQIMHFAILYAKLMKVCAVISSPLDAFEQALNAYWVWRNLEKLLLWSEVISCNVLNLLSANSSAHILLMA